MPECFQRLRMVSSHARVDSNRPLSVAIRVWSGLIFCRTHWQRPNSFCEASDSPTKRGCREANLSTALLRAPRPTKSQSSPQLPGQPAALEGCWRDTWLELPKKSSAQTKCISHLLKTRPQMQSMACFRVRLFHDTCLDSTLQIGCGPQFSSSSVEPMLSVGAWHLANDSGPVACERSNGSARCAHVRTSLSAGLQAAWSSAVTPLATVDLKNDLIWDQLG